MELNPISGKSYSKSEDNQYPIEEGHDS
jgi:hypothetical protein